MRSSVDLLKEKIYKLKIEAKNLKDINLDFKRIEFVSRSAAHEILKLKSEFEKDGIFLSFSNQNEFVRRMFVRIINILYFLLMRFKPTFSNSKFNNQRNIKLKCILHFLKYNFLHLFNFIRRNIKDKLVMDL